MFCQLVCSWAYSCETADNFPIFTFTGVTGHSKAASEAELEEIVASLRDGSADARSAAAERLFNKAAMDESARLRTTSMGVVQPLVSNESFRPFISPCSLQRKL